MFRTVLGGVPTIFVVVTGCGLAAGLYRHRYLRGSRDEVRAVIVAGVLTAGCLTGICLAFGGGRRILPGIVPNAVFVVAVMLGARYVNFAARLRLRRPASTAEKIIVIGAGEAGQQVITAMLRNPSGATCRWR